MSQKFDNNVLDLLERKRFYPYEYMSDFEKFQEKFPSKEMFYSYYLIEALLTNNMNMFSMFGINLKWKRWKIVTTCI